MTKIFNNKPAVLVPALALGLAFTVYYSYGQLTANHIAARSVTQDLAHSRSIAADINRLRTEPILANPDEPQLNELTRHIEQSAKEANIPLDLLVRIWPDPVRRIASSPYKRKSTQVLFRQVTLRQIITFLHKAASQDAGPQITRLALIAADEKSASNHWTAETTLTHLIYDPKIQVKGK